MRVTRPLVSGVASLGLVIILAACGQPAAAPQSPSAPADSPEPTPTVEPSPSESPSEEPSTPEVTEHELPMVGRVTDPFDVRTLPSLDAPILTGERADDLSRVDVSLETDALVHVDVGPVVADGLSWYRVAATPDATDVYFGFGWMPGESLEREDDYPSGFLEITAIHGLGSGSAASADVLAGTPVSVAFAAAPMADDESCEAEVTVIRTDGAAVNVATETVTEAMAFELGADTHGTGLQSLFMEEAGQITLQVRSDCAFAASAITLAS